MTTTRRIAFALLLSATGCTVGDMGPAGDGSGGGNGGGGNNGGGDDVPAAADASGRYTMRSTYDVATNMPGKIGAVANEFIAATDDPDDPTNWLLTKMIDAMPDGTVKSFLSSSKDYVAGYLNDQLLAWAPSFVSTMVQIGNDFGDMTKHFGLNEELDVAGSADAYVATHTVNGMHFKFGSQEEDFAFADYQVANVVVPNVGVTLDATGRLTIAQHDVPLHYGQVLRIGLDNGIIPRIDPNAHDLGSLMTDQIDCDTVGYIAADAVGFGSPSTYADACRAGIDAGASYLYSKIADIDADALNFGIAGTARAVDTNGDGASDKLQTGTWTGQLSYAGTPAPLSTATFHAERE